MKGLVTRDSSAGAADSLLTCSIACSSVALMTSRAAVAKRTERASTRVIASYGSSPSAPAGCCSSTCWASRPRLRRRAPSTAPWGGITPDVCSPRRRSPRVRKMTILLGSRLVAGGAVAALALSAGAQGAVAGARSDAGTTSAGHTAAPAGTPGAAGIGDRLFPELGNGGYDAKAYDLT